MIKSRKISTIVCIALSVLAIALIAIFAYMEMRNSGKIGSLQSKKLMEDFHEVYNSDELEVVFYASSTCGYCELQKPILETIADEYDMDYLAINANELSYKQRKEIMETLDIEGATPTIVIVEDGKVIATQVGYMEEQDLIKFFSDNGVIPEQFIHYIDYSGYEELLKNKETNIIVIGQTGCGNCTLFKPALNSVGEDYDLIMNYLNLAEMTTSETESLVESLEEIGYDDPEFLEDGSFGTPLTLIVKNGKVKNYIIGLRTNSQLVRELKKVGMIEE